jgi:Protein of unknown function (DUF2721)
MQRHKYNHRRLSFRSDLPYPVLIGVAMLISNPPVFWQPRLAIFFVNGGLANYLERGAAMQSTFEISTVAHAIQLSVAPVFLLTGIGAILTVITNRIARIVDRFRTLGNSDDQIQSSHKDEITMLSRRARWVHWSVSLCTFSALFICMVIAALFVGSETGIDPSRIVSLFFILAMLSLIFGLLCFLREIFLATGNIEVRNN